MPVPTGVTRIPRRSVSYTTLSTFPLVGRLSNTVAGDLANPGNTWLTGGNNNRREAVAMEAAQDAGSIMAVVLGYDVRNWVQIVGDVAIGNANECLRPNSIYFMNRAQNTDVICGLAANGFKPGDRVTFVNNGAGRLDFYLAGIRHPSGTTISRIRLKGSNPGASFTLEYGYLETGTPTLGFHLIYTNGTIGDLFDGNPVGVS